MSEPTPKANEKNFIITLGSKLSPYFIFIRGIQFLFTILVLALTANTVNDFPAQGTNIWSLVVSLMSFIFLVSVMVLSRFYMGFLNPGAVIIVEGLICIFYFTAFIAQAADFGGLNCDLYTSSYFNGLYTVYGGTDLSSGCKTAKASIAFLCLNFVLFLLTFLLVLFQVIIPISKAHSSHVWMFCKDSGVVFDQSVLNIKTLSTVSKSYDEETAVGDIEPGKVEEVADPVEENNDNNNNLSTF